VRTSTSGQGRKPGVPNKATAEIKTLAREFGPAAIAKLAQLSGLIANKPGAENESARIAAIKELLDRGYGKAMQPTDITSNGDTVRYVIMAVPEAEDTDTWLQQYAPKLITTQS
jgi:hypothetical protein